MLSSFLMVRATLDKLQLVDDLLVKLQNIKAIIIRAYAIETSICDTNYRWSWFKVAIDSNAKFCPTNKTADNFVCHLSRLIADVEDWDLSAQEHLHASMLSVHFSSYALEYMIDDGVLDTPTLVRGKVGRFSYPGNAFKHVRYNSHFHINLKDLDSLATELSAADELLNRVFIRKAWLVVDLATQLAQIRAMFNSKRLAKLETDCIRNLIAVNVAAGNYAENLPVYATIISAEIEVCGVVLDLANAARAIYSSLEEDLL